MEKKMKKRVHVFGKREIQGAFDFLKCMASCTGRIPSVLFTTLEIFAGSLHRND
jgi:hypothetical protein